MARLTVRIPGTLRDELADLCRRQQRPLSEVVRESLRRYVTREQLRQIRGKLRPYAKAEGFLTDEDVFETIS
jgi:predicted transcriptional regulator